ncbi:MAG: IS30 family transposase [Gallionellaceae bacterium]|nr:MAG: IS30 family transposase [Gallionellaceae bacterium]
MVPPDNGKEFSGHGQAAKALDAGFYFAHPCASWERGTSENTNGPIRQHFPKNRGFTTIARQEISHAMKRSDNGYRKRLGFLTPAQAFFKPGASLQN